MRKKLKKSSVDRRDFLRNGAIVGAATLVTPGKAAHAQPAQPPRAVPMVPTPETDPPPEIDALTEGRSGSDFMVDVIKSLGFEYICANPGSSFRGLHESVINYGGNQSPEFITYCHEESSVAMAHGYSKIEGKPLCVFAHGTVGLQHASMAIYNAWCDRVPVYIILGNSLDAIMRRPGAEWDHSVQDAAAMVRDYIKWDDTPLFAPALRRVRSARLQDRDDPADGAGAARGRQRIAGKSGSRRGARAVAYPEADSG
jgi:acetolactate synthase-1/2/3 large subunit